MSRNTTNRLESNPGHLHWIRGLQQMKVIGEWHFVKSVYAFHLWRVKHMNFLAEVYLICGFCQGWDILLYESPRRKPGWRFTAGFQSMSVSASTLFVEQDGTYSARRVIRSQEKIDSDGWRHGWALFFEMSIFRFVPYAQIFWVCIFRTQLGTDSNVKTFLKLSIASS